MRAYKEKHLRLFTEWLFRNRLKTIRLGALFLVWGWPDGKAAIVAVRKSDEFIVRKKHRKVYSILMDAINGGGLRLCRWDEQNKMRVYDLETEPEWNKAVKEKKELERDKIGGENE